MVQDSTAAEFYSADLLPFENWNLWFVKLILTTWTNSTDTFDMVYFLKLPLVSTLFLNLTACNKIFKVPKIVEISI